MGWFIGRYVYDTHMSHLAHHHAFFLPMLVPEIEPFSRRYGLTLVFGGAGGRALPQEGSCSVARMGTYLSSRPDCGMMSRP